MRLINVRPDTLVGKTIIFRNQFWFVDAVSDDQIHLTKGYRGHLQKGRLRVDQLHDCRIFPSFEDVAETYPRLIKALRWACILSQTEAENCVQGFLTTGAHYMGSEAVAHVGGAIYAIRHAIRCRRAISLIARAS